MDDNYVGLATDSLVDWPYTGATGGTHIIGYDAFATIQGGINGAVANGIVNVAAGTYVEAVIVNKAVTLYGNNADVPWAERGEESIVKMVNGATVFTVAADHVEINGFEIIAPLSNNALSHTVGTIAAPTEPSHLKYAFNNIHDVGTERGSGSVFGIQYLLRSGTPSDIVVADNHFANIGGLILPTDTTKRGSSGAVFFGDSTATGTLTGLVIERNLIVGVTVKATNKSSWGIIINTGGGSTGKVTGAIIRNNEVSQISGGVAKGIALEGKTPNALVVSNKVSDVTTAIRLESNSGADTVTIAFNRFERVTTGISNTATGTVKAELNWWGSDKGPKITANPGGDGYTVSSKVDFSPWLGDGTDLDTDPVIGFQPNLEPLYHTVKSLKFSVQPADAVLGATLGPVTVQAINEISGVATQFTGTVTLTISTNPGSPNPGVLNGTKSLQFVNGEAIFDGLSISVGTGEGYILRAASTYSTTLIPTTTSAAFNIIEPVTIGSRVWYDTNTNGIQDATEQGITNITVTLYRLVELDGGALATNKVASILTGEDGSYLFKTTPGAYVLRVDILPGHSFSPLNQGEKETDSDFGQNTLYSAPITVEAGKDALNIDAGMYRNPTPTLSVITSFRAFERDGDVFVAWETAREYDTVGYWIERRIGEDWVRINCEEPVWSELTGAPTAYELADVAAIPGGTYTWRIIEFESSGKENLYGPYTVTVDGAAADYDAWAEGINWGASASGRDDDSDHDGLTNFEEFLAGTDPLNANSVLKITSLKFIGNDIEIRWASVAGRVYAVEHVTKLGAAWLPVKAGIIAKSDETTFVLPGADSGFFRVIVHGFRAEARNEELGARD